MHLFAANGSASNCRADGSEQYRLSPLEACASSNRAKRTESPKKAGAAEDLPPQHAKIPERLALRWLNGNPVRHAAQAEQKMLALTVELMNRTEPSPKP